ncbi:MAG: SLBB domain-containing protein [Proteobacteria bacterium]|nr:SLBB domain-containing protein [Pseudomonadota bacterium]
MKRYPVPTVAVLVFAVCSIFFALRAPAQGVTPTPEQLQMFEGLTPEQQQMVLQAISGGSSLGGLGGSLGGGLNGVGGLGGASGIPGARSQMGDPRQQMGRQSRRLSEEEEEEGPEPVIPQLKAKDWVIVEIDYQLAPRAIPPYLQSLYSLQASAPGAASAAPSAQAASQSQPVSALAAAVGQVPGPSSGSAVPGQPSPEDRARLDPLIALIRAKNPYRLTQEGALLLPGFAPMALLGLTEEQATLRLRADPAFRGVDVRLTRLPIKKSGVEGLRPFGYDLFDHLPSTFAPVTNVPVPSDYTVGAGDLLLVQLYGSQNRSLKLTVSRDGTISLPDLGPMVVAGQKFNNVKDSIEGRIERQMTGVRANVSMGDTRAIRVFVFGEARNLGSYTISGLGTITSALYAAGGVRRTGSLRNIQLKRNGAVIRRLDLYDLLIRGDTSDDTKLLQGDVVFVPTVGSTVSVDGEVRRPAIYEVKNETTVGDVLALAGGVTPEADPTKVSVTRIDGNEHRVVVSVDLTAAGRGAQLRNGDVVRVMRIRPTLDAGIVVEGHLYTPETFAYRSGIRLSDVVHSVDELKPDADIHYLLVRRESPVDHRISVFSADLEAALQAPGSAADLELAPRDRITVFDLASGRDRIIQPIMDQLKLQGTSGQPSAVVHVDGSVHVPGDYPLEPTMTVRDLVRAGGGTVDSTYGRTAELTRYTVTNGESRHTELIRIDLAAAMRGDPAANVKLQPFDSLSVREVPLWGEAESVTLKGEVRFPGSYSIRRGETLQSVINRAGGLTDFAFPEGSVFTRESLRKREQAQMDMLADRMQHDLSILALQAAATSTNGGGAGALSVGQALLSQLRTTRAVGRLVIDLPRIMREPADWQGDVILRDGDELIVPRTQQQVTVIGEVQNPTSLLYNAKLGRDDYISLSGGTTRRADHARIYVVRANGSVVAQEGSRWYSRSSVQIKTGDTIVVPLDAEKMPTLPLWLAVTQILYNVAIAVAAVNAL